MGGECVVGVHLPRGVEWVAALAGHLAGRRGHICRCSSRCLDQRRNFMIIDASVEAVIGDSDNDFPEGVERSMHLAAATACRRRSPGTAGKVGVRSGLYDLHVGYHRQA